jgi:nitrogen fixation protein FixH
MIMGEGGQPLTGRHVLAGILGFFGVIFAVNGIFLYHALSTHNGAERVGAYERGLRYNDTLAEERAQVALGWSHRMTANASRIDLHMTGQAGNPVRGLEIDGRVGRPAASRFDRAVTFTETAPGHYTARVDLAEGGWIATLSARRPGQTYSLKERVWLPPQQP